MHFYLSSSSLRLLTMHMFQNLYHKTFIFEMVCQVNIKQVNIYEYVTIFVNRLLQIKSVELFLSAIFHPLRKYLL